jgi:hypothetical protein
VRGAVAPIRSRNRLNHFWKLSEIYLPGMDLVPRSLNRAQLLSSPFARPVPQARRLGLTQFNHLENRAPVACRRVPTGAEGMAWGRGGDDARHS